MSCPTILLCSELTRISQVVFRFDEQSRRDRQDGNLETAKTPDVIDVGRDVDAPAYVVRFFDSLGMADPLTLSTETWVPTRDGHHWARPFLCNALCRFGDSFRYPSSSNAAFGLYFGARIPYRVCFCTNANGRHRRAFFSALRVSAEPATQPLT